MGPTQAPEFCLLWINWWPMCMAKAEWSGWVQAFGSIAAIWFGFRFVGRANYLAQRADRTAQLQAHLEGCSLLIQKLDKQANALRACLETWKRGDNIGEAELRRASYFHALVRDAKPLDTLPAEEQLQWLIAHADSGEAFGLVAELHGGLPTGMTKVDVLAPQILQRVLAIERVMRQLCAYSEMRLMTAGHAESQLEEGTFARWRRLVRERVINKSS